MCFTDTSDRKWPVSISTPMCNTATDVSQTTSSLCSYRIKANPQPIYIPHVRIRLNWSHKCIRGSEPANGWWETLAWHLSVWLIIYKCDKRFKTPANKNITSLYKINQTPISCLMLPTNLFSHFITTSLTLSKWITWNLSHSLLLPNSSLNGPVHNYSTPFNLKLSVVLTTHIPKHYYFILHYICKYEFNVSKLN